MAIDLEPLSIADAWIARSTQHEDDRGSFTEWFRPDQLLAATGRPFPVAQANLSISHRGVLRGVHFADVPPGQAKWVRCVRGDVFDVVVDLRVGSPTFGQHCGVLLSDRESVGVVIGEGLGHAFCAVTDDATVSYLLTAPYNPATEHGVDPLDTTLDIPWPVARDQLVLSEKDAVAPSIAEAARTGLLPTWEACKALYED